MHRNMREVIDWVLELPPEIPIEEAIRCKQIFYQDNRGVGKAIHTS